MDSAQDFRDAVDRGETVLNYGLYFEYKTQSWDYDLTGFSLGGATDAGGTTTSNHYVPRNLKQYSPDLWAKVGVGRFTIEAELVAQVGSLDVLTDAATGTVTSYDIRKFGGAGRVTWRGLDGKLRLGVERLRVRRPVGQHPAGRHQPRVQQPARWPRRRHACRPSSRSTPNTRST